MLLGRVHLLGILAFLAAAAGCVVPAGPQWTDPQANFPPTISYDDTTPPVGSVLAMDPDGGAPLEVEVVLADQNTQDKLYARWIVDYPPNQPGVSRVALEQGLLGGNQVKRPPFRFSPSCTDDAISHDFSNHRLLLAVSDRPFPNDISQQPFEFTGGNFLVEASWQFELDCH